MIMVFGIISAIFFAFVAIIKFFYNGLFRRNQDNLDDYNEGWFGREPSPPSDDDLKISNEDTAIRPFRIEVSEDILTDLQRRLENTKFHEPLQEVNFTYGFNSKYLREVVEYWRTQYQWRKQEENLNKYSHFKTKIEGIDVHFVHIKPKLPERSEIRVLPILITHGWPGSFLEFYKMIPFLTTPRPDRDFVFEVICPSIPGYGFSEAPHRKGFNARSTSRMFVTLMQRIGHEMFYVQGGDWGSLVSATIARYYPNNVRGIHLNMFAADLNMWGYIKMGILSYFPFLIRREEHQLLYPLKKRMIMLLEETGYLHLQATKPDTIGCALSDSPAGLAAYILEKFSVWTQKENLNFPDGKLTDKFAIDELLTNIMIYWVTNSYTSSARFYKENIKAKRDKFPIRVKSAVAAFPNELLMFPRTLLTSQLPNLVSYNIMPRGGHFAAMEEPQLLADDIWQFARAVEKK